jgi:hypothetical protein
MFPANLVPNLAEWNLAATNLAATNLAEWNQTDHLS